MSMKSKQTNITMHIKYVVSEAVSMSDADFKKCAALFSSYYGRYRMDSPRKPGENIAMSADFFRKRYCRENVYIATCKNGSYLIGQAIYKREYIDGLGTMTWVEQLVVHSNYRKLGVGSTLLHSIWGFSDDFAWGLATANPCTVKALENATLRKCTPAVISQNIKYIEDMSRGMGDFVRPGGFEISDNCSIADTQFFIDNSEFDDTLELLGNWKLGKLKPGYEWIAFTFREQEIDKELYKKHIDNVLAFDEVKLKDAYSRMDMKKHSWTKGTDNEISVILKLIGKNGFKNVLDVGCGIGRHSYEIAKYADRVKGIDFSSKLLRTARRKNHSNKHVSFSTADAREYYDSDKYDLILCLYDVIGSYPDDGDNKKILDMIYRQLSEDGYLALSVMNMELTESIAFEAQRCDISANPEKLFSLKPSDTMQQLGNIFDPNYLLIDTNKSVVYRKEQFSNDKELPAEYIVRDKRYRMNEIVSMVEECGFTVVHKAYVQAGHFDVELSALDEKAKEIFLVVKKSIT